MVAQFKDTCDTHHWKELQDEEAGKSSLLCQGVAYLAMGRADEGRRILSQIVKQSPHSDAAFEAQERLLGYYARTGQMREASRELSALFAIKPTDPDVLDNRSLFETFGNYPDMVVLHRQPVSFSKEQTDGILNIPISVNGEAATFFLDSGSNFSVVSDSEARSMGLTIIPVKTTLEDSGGTKSSMQVAVANEIDVGPIRLRNVPFLVLPAANPPFNGLPLKQQGLLGIQVANALQTVRLDLSGKVDLAVPSTTENAMAERLTWDDMMPVLHIKFMGRQVPFTFDTGAEKTILNEPFSREFPEIVALGTKKDHKVIGLGGAVTRPSAELSSWTVILGGKTVSIDKVSVLLEKNNGESEWATGNLGLDVLLKCEPFTIDFVTMRLTTGT